MPPGCPFSPRCPLHVAECDIEEPPLFDVGPEHTAACIRTEVVARAGGDASEVFDTTSVDAVLVEPASAAEVDIDQAAGALPEQTHAPQGGTGTGTTSRGDRS
jgi:peptide/nickel transport system ATP-binding protein